MLMIEEIFINFYQFYYLIKKFHLFKPFIFSGASLQQVFICLVVDNIRLR